VMNEPLADPGVLMLLTARQHHRLYLMFRNEPAWPC
jgi:hypothetical protein